MQSLLAADKGFLSVMISLDMERAPLPATPIVDADSIRRLESTRPDHNPIDDLNANH
ncbi:MAG: hypothetical protein WDZ60_11185 [Wenzhouxiangellaceae bacterium]